MLFRNLLLLGLLLAGAKAQADKPNIVFIFADDHNFETVGFMGHPQIKTPNLDSLANKGAVFERAYNMGAWTGAVCISSRNMINTGLSVWRAHEVDKTFRTKKGQEGGTKAKEQQQELLKGFWANRMEKAGYDTYMSGKWHVKAPVNGSFDIVGTERPGMPKQTVDRYNRRFDRNNDNWSPYDKSFGGFWEGGQHWSEGLADEAIDYINNKKSSDKPFFMYIGFNAPHDPRQAPKSYIDMYPLDEIVLPNNYTDQYPFMQDIGLLFPNRSEGKRVLRDEKLGPLPRTEYSTKVNLQEYYALISHMDTQIGRIVEQLRANGQIDNTVFIFTADHGLAVGQHGLLGKQNLYEHSMRAPFFVTGKGIPAGVRRDTPIYIQDAMATALDLADADNKGVEFKSVLPLISNRSLSQYPRIYGAYVDNQRAVIVDNYKLLLYPQAKVVQLFDLNKDRSETNNLAYNPEMREKVKFLFKQLEIEQQALEDKLDLRQVYPEWF